MTEKGTPAGPLDGVQVLEDGAGLAIAVAGLLLQELGASVARPAGAPAPEGPGRILHRRKQPASDPEHRYDVYLIGPGQEAPAQAGVVISFPDPPSEDLAGLSRAGSMLAEARSGLMWLQVGHREGPYCLAQPIVGLGAGILGALSAVSGLLSRARGAPQRWRSSASYGDGGLVMQTLSAAFLAQPATGTVRPRYRDPYSVSYSPIMRFQRASDGWVFIAAISAHMWHSLFCLIGHPELADDQELQAELPFNIADQARGEHLAALVGQWVAGLTVNEVVDVCVRHKIVAAPALSSRDFLRHPQAVANGLPTLVRDEQGEQLQAGGFLHCTPADQPAMQLGPLASIGAGPLYGVRVVDVSRAAAGPICGRVLADLGAEVVRIEDPAGETSRRVGLTFASNNRNKLSLGLDLHVPAGLELLARLTEQADVVLTNALPEATVRLRIDPPAVAARNPSACYVSVLGFGRRPPFGGRRVVDAAAQALSGQALAEGGGQEPVGCTGGFLDNGTGWLAALGCVASLYQRQTVGRAGTVEAALLNSSAFVQLLNMCDPPQPSPGLDTHRWGYSADQRLYQLLDCWICVAAQSRAERQAFAAVLASLQCEGGDSSVHGPAAAALAAALAGFSIAEATGVFSRAGFTAWTVVRTLEQAARAGDGDFVEVAQQPWGGVLETRLLPRYEGDERPAIRGAAVAPGSDDAQILARHGVSARHRDELIAVGALRSEPPAVAFYASTV